MAIEPKKTKAERRAEARAERKEQAEREAKQAKVRRWRSIGLTVLTLAVIGVILIPTFQRLLGDDVPSDLTIAAADAAAARDAAGCEVLVEDTPLPDRDHLDPATAPPADVLYANAEVRPTYSGSHFGVVSPRIDNVPRTPIEERSVVHNMEHGAITVWFDEATLDGGAQGAIGDWGESRNDLGFASRAGGAVFTSAYDGTITSGKPIAFRAWGQAMDCDSWDETVADAFVIDHYGTHGIAPERNLSPYPEEAMGYSDDESGDTPEGEGPQDAESDPIDSTEEVTTDSTEDVLEPSGPESESGTDAATDTPTPTDAATETATPTESES